MAVVRTWIEHFMVRRRWTSVLPVQLKPAALTANCVGSYLSNLIPEFFRAGEAARWSGNRLEIGGWTVKVSADGIAGREYEPFNADLSRRGVSSAFCLWYG